MLNSLPHFHKLLQTLINLVFLFPLPSHFGMIEPIPVGQFCLVSCFHGEHWVEIKIFGYLWVLKVMLLGIPGTGGNRLLLFFPLNVIKSRSHIFLQCQ